MILIFHFNVVCENAQCKLWLHKLGTAKVTCFVTTFWSLGVRQVCSGFGGFFSSLQMLVHIHCCSKSLPTFYLKEGFVCSFPITLCPSLAVK